MSSKPLLADPLVSLDIEAAFDWYERERPGLGPEFLPELLRAYRNITAGPQRYRVIRSGIRRALLSRFPYAVYFVENDAEIIVLAVLHASRTPARWQKRGYGAS